jgi:hypothetical protein
MASNTCRTPYLRHKDVVVWWPPWPPFDPLPPIGANSAETAAHSNAQLASQIFDEGYVQAQLAAAETIEATTGSTIVKCWTWLTS